MRKLNRLACLAKTYLRAEYQNVAYCWFGKEPVKYSNAVIQINRQCNSRCVMCSSHQADPSPVELTTEQVIEILEKLKSHNQHVKVCFVGGEPTLRKDFGAILDYCRRRSIICSIVTNGILLDSTRAQELLQHEPFALHVSLDSLDADVYKRIRGVDRVDVVKRNIVDLVAVARRMKVGTFIGIKTVITAENHRKLTELAEFARSSGASGIHYQPILVRSSTHGSARLFPKPGPELVDSVQQLARWIKNKNGVVVNTPANIGSWLSYFEGNQPRRRFCSTSMQNLFVHADGSVKLCEKYDATIGNVLEHETIGDLIRTEEASRQRREMTNCQRHCAFIISRGFSDYLALAARHIFSR